jgi:hypothetical protein
MKYVCASDSLRPGQLNRLISTIKDGTTSKEKSTMQTYIGCKIIQAEPMDETITGVKIPRQGYRVVYPDGYASWSPKEVFEEAYRPISLGEKSLILEPEKGK